MSGQFSQGMEAHTRVPQGQVLYTLLYTLALPSTSVVYIAEVQVTEGGPKLFKFAGGPKLFKMMENEVGCDECREDLSKIGCNAISEFQCKLKLCTLEQNA